MGVRKLAGQTMIYGLSSIIGRAINSVVLSFLYVNYFEPNDFGLFSFFFALISYPIIILVIGQETAFFRQANKQYIDPERAYSNGFWSVTYTALAVCGTCFLLSEELAAAVGFPARGLLMRYLVAIVFLDVLVAMPLARLRHRERPLLFAGIQLVNVVVLVVLNVWFVAVLHWDIEAIFLANLFASIVKTCLGLAYGLPKHRSWEWETSAPMLAFGALIMVAGFAGQINEMLDKNLLVTLWPKGKLFLGQPRTGAELNGIYNASYKFGLLMVVATQAFRYAAEPFFFRQARGENSPVLFARVFHFFMMLGLATTLLVAAFRYEVAFFDFFGLLRGPLLPEAYWPGLKIIPIILVANLFLGLYINVAIWFKLLGKAKWGLWFTLVGTALTIAINYWGIPLHGYYASAWAHLACYGTMFWVCYAVGQRKYPIPYRVGRFLVYLTLVVGGIWLMEMTGDGFRHNNFVRWAVVLGVTGAILGMERLRPAFSAADRSIG